MLHLLPLLLLCQLLLGPASLTRTPNGYWVAKRDGKILWKRPSVWKYMREKLDFYHAGIWVIASEDRQPDGFTSVLVVDSRGVIRSQLPLAGLSDPRCRLHQGRYFVYDYGAYGIPFYNSEAEGRHLEKWLNNNTGVLTYDLKTFCVVREESVLSGGLPQSLQNGRLTSLCVLNPTDCLRHDWKMRPRFPIKPQLAIVERDIATGRILRRAQLRLTQTEARELYENFMDRGEYKPASIVWHGKRVQVTGLFKSRYQAGYNCEGSSL